MSQYHIDTNCIHAGYTPGDGEPRVVPMYKAQRINMTMRRQRQAVRPGAGWVLYTRLANPTLDAVEEKIAALEGGVGALTILRTGGVPDLCFEYLPRRWACRCSSAIYGGTFNLFYKTMHEMGIGFTFFAGKHRRKS